MLLGIAATAQAGPVLKAGSWKFTFYQEPGQTTTSTKDFCVNAKHTWSTLSPIPGHGGWTQNGNDIGLYGTISEILQGAAFSAIGQIVGADTITGHYQFFNIVQNPPNGSHGAFKAVFKGEVCPL